VNVMTRQEALKAGLTRYFTGKPCPRGHISERRVSGACGDCARELKREYNKTSLVAKVGKARSQKNNRASANARNRKYAETHREELRLKNAAYGKANPDKGCAKATRYRATKLNATPSWADHVAIGMIYRAAEVIRITGFDVHVDHVVPLQGKRVTGLHVHNNLRVIQANANRSKSNHF
jgi:hypothetical protein